LWLQVEVGASMRIGGGPADLRPAMDLELTYEVVNLNSQCICNDFECLNCHIALPALDFPHMRTVQPRAIGEDVL
jgi:hypothetical protein